MRALYKGYGDLSQTYFLTVKKNAEKRNIEFNISINECYNIIEKQNFKCQLSGLPIVLDRHFGQRKKLQTASLDRIDSTIGYIKSNVQWIYKDFGDMKWNDTDSNFINNCLLIYNYKKLNIQKEKINYIEPRTSGRFNGYKDLSGKYFSKCKQNANARNIKFSLSIEETWNQLEKQDFRCPLSGLQLFLLKSIDKQNASLDRINSKLPYTSDNIQWIYKPLNKMKNDYDQDYFVQMCCEVARYQLSLTEENKWQSN